MRMVTGTVMALPVKASAAGHRRKQRDLARARDRRVRPDMGMVDGGADHARRGEGWGIFVAAGRQPADQFLDRAHARRRFDNLLGLADPFTDPGKVLDLHAASSSMR